MKTLMIYDRLVPVNREQHRDLKLPLTVPDFDFAREANSLLISGGELHLAALDMPCVFVRSGDDLALLAVTGLREKENLLVDARGQWADRVYVPAFVRRYPFVLAETDGKEELTLYVDEACKGWNAADGQPLFDAAGQESDWLKGHAQFMLNFHEDLQRTLTMSRRLQQLDLLIERDLDFRVGDAKFNLNGFLVVDEEKLRALPAEVVHELASSGMLGWVYAHLLSLGNINKLGARLVARLQAA